MADHSKPVTTDLYTDVLTLIRGRIDDALRQLDPANSSPTNLPTGAIRFNASLAKWQTWNGTLWGDLQATYNINISGFVNGTVVPPASTVLTTDATQSVVGKTFDRLRASNASDASLISTAHGLQIGPDGATNLIADVNEIMARNNGSAATLALNAEGGNVTVGAAFGAATGISLTDGLLDVSRTHAACANFNRQGGVSGDSLTDGVVVQILRAGLVKGTITVAGEFVGYNSFLGTHWSQPADNSGVELLRGTVLDSVVDLCSWPDQPLFETKRVPVTDIAGRISYKQIPLRNDQGKMLLDDDGNPRIIDSEEPKTEMKTVPILDETGNQLFGKDENTNLPKFKVSEVVESKAVYGVFHKWDEDGDAEVASIGAFVIRLAKGTRPKIGDYLQSNGDGCAKVQKDDILRSSTIAKVTSTKVAIVYDDGSFLVPCTLHCG